MKVHFDGGRDTDRFTVDLPRIEVPLPNRGHGVAVETLIERPLNADVIGMAGQD